MSTQRREKRAYGSGSIVEERGSWYGKWRIGDRQVKRKLGPVRPVGSSDGFTRKQAEAALRRMMSDVKILAPEERITFGEAAERYVHHVEHVMRRKALRHTFGTRMAAVGVPMRTLQEWMGHRDFTTTLVYADFAPDPAGGAAVWIADLEKTLLDSLDAPHLAGPMPVVIAALDQAARQGTLDPQRLVAYAIKMGGPVLNRRLGYFMEKLEIPGASELEPHLGRKSAVALQPGRAPRRGAKVDPRWRVYSDEALVSSAKELK
jgi:hypothetical protein